MSNAELMFLETSALTGENVEEAFVQCARKILNKIESGKLSFIFIKSFILSENEQQCTWKYHHSKSSNRIKPKNPKFHFGKITYLFSSCFSYALLGTDV